MMKTDMRSRVVPVAEDGPPGGAGSGTGDVGGVTPSRFTLPVRSVVPDPHRCGRIHAGVSRAVGPVGSRMPWDSGLVSCFASPRYGLKRRSALRLPVAAPADS